MDKQKFKRGDLVHIAAELRRSMSHFRSDKDVVVLGSYADRFGGSNTSDYQVLFVEDGGEVSWYDECQLTLLEHVGESGIDEIVSLREQRRAIESALPWIVENWSKIREKPPCATMEKLMSLIGITEPWGKHGEGIDYHNNTKYAYKCFDSVLSTGDIDKVNEFIETFPKVNEFIFSSDLYHGHNELRRPKFIPA